ncbi:MAG: hypothetical protein ICV81_16905, partial [Flavisolibacter sp.]|nr:hypothetical protein [Flavisolibacter sp.]
MNPIKTSIYLLSALIAGLASCKKENSVTSDTTTTSTSPTIAVAASAATAIGSADTVYVMQRCERGSKRTEVVQSSLPTSIADYLASNYNGYAFHKAFTINNSTESVTGYVVIIYYNDKPVGLEFDSNGAFVKVLEQRERSDLQGTG